jgi:8-oxo-dGTP pyrophosphatase MutT (NUDIX family)
MDDSLNVCAGGIIIDPWNDIENAKSYNILVVKQRNGNFWGLPKGHQEEKERSVYSTALREVREETGIDFNSMRYDYDYVTIPICRDHTLNNKIMIKKIHFFVFVLLRRGCTYRRNNFDQAEISCHAWINSEKLLNLCTQSKRFKCNRTLSKSSIDILSDICQKTKDYLSLRLTKLQVQRGYASVYRPQNNTFKKQKFARLTK